MKSPHVYDKAKYHSASIEQAGLPEEHACNHTVVFLRWLLEHDLMSQEFVRESDKILKEFRAGKATIYKVYEYWDCCLVDDMLSEEGNAFAMHYFDFDKGQYIRDYIDTLQGSLPSEFYITFSEDNYQTMRRIMDSRYEEWKRPKKRGWWPF